ncbi:MAG: DUF928 domain-containing protein [Pleurocapsa sp.]
MVLNCGLLISAEPTTAEAKKSQVKATNSDFGLPTHRRDGGSRGSRNDCVNDAENQNMMALIPEQTLGFNASAAPKLFFYVPEVNNQRTLEFVLRNEQDQLMYEAFISTEGNGIMSVEIPADVQPNLLATEQNYHWYLSMICDTQQRSRDIVVEGWLRQEAIDTATKEQLNTASFVEQAEVYSEQGFWYDALSVLAENHDSLAEQPMVRQKWSEMLQSVGLGELASKPFIEKELIEAPAAF